MADKEYIDTSKIPAGGSREFFNESWLCEMPQIIPKTDYYPQLHSRVNEIKDSNLPIQPLGNNWFKWQGTQTIVYWNETSDIIIGGEFTIKHQALVVNYVSKNPKFKGSGPYASDLYEFVLHDQGLPIRIHSDTQLSDEGFKIWSRLIDNGHKIYVYDRNDPGRSFRLLTVDDLKKYHGQTSEFQNYQYIVESEYVLARSDDFELKSSFNLRRFRELSGSL